MTTPSITYIVITASLGVLLWTSAATSETGRASTTASGGTQGLQEQMYEERMKEMQAAPSAQDNKKPQMKEGGSSGSESSASGNSNGAPRSPKKGETGGVSSPQGGDQSAPSRK